MTRECDKILTFNMLLLSSRLLGVFCLTIYADVLLCVNFIIDYFLLGLTVRVLKTSCSFSRQLIGAGVGAVSSLVILLPNLNYVLSIILLVLTSAVTIITTFGINKITVLLKQITCFYVASFLFTGAMAVLSKILKTPSLIVRNGVVYYNLSAVLLVVFAVITYLAITLVCKYLKRNSEPTCKLSIIDGDVNLQVIALVDSGNRLQEPFSEKWVMLLDSQYEKLFSNVKSPKRIIPYATIGGEGVLYGFCPESIKLLPNGEKLDMYVAFSPHPIKSGYNAIISAEAF